MIQTLRAHRLFRGIICHRIFINLGDSLFYIVLMWVLYDLTNDPIDTSVGGFMFSLSDVLNFFCGPIIDRSNKRYLLFISSGIPFSIVLGLYLLSANGMLSVFFLILSIPFFNLMSKMTYSIHNVIVPGIVTKENLIAANSVLSITNTGIDLLFNAVTGVLLALLSLQNIFLVNSSINLLALLVALIGFRGFTSKSSLSAAKKGRTFSSFDDSLRTYRSDLKMGLVFLKNRTVLSLIIPLTGLNLLYAMMLVTLPVFSSELYGSAMGYGLTLTLFAVGSITGSAVSGWFMKQFSVGTILPVLFLYGGVSWIFTAFLIQRLPIAGAIFIVVASSALGIINIVFNTIFQQLPSENMIGRVNTVNLSLMAIAALFGSLLGGVIVKILDCVFPFTLCGLGYLSIAVMMRLNRCVYKLPKLCDINERSL